MLNLNTNVPSLLGQNALNRSESPLDTSAERLASGKRINSAKDDAAGLALALQYAAQLAGGEQAYRNVNDAVSTVQVADSATAGVTENLQRMRELAVQSGNGTLGASERQALQAEFSQLREEITRTVDTTELNGQALLQGGGSTQFQVGPDAGNTVSVDRPDVNAGLATAGLGAADISTSAGAASALAALDQGIDYMGSVRGEFGAAINRLEATGRNLAETNVNVAEANSRIADADYARETAEYTRNMILRDSATAMLGQANALPQMVANLLG